LKVVKAQLGIILILVAIYFLQAATPLRLHPDTVVLLSIAETAAHGGGYVYHGQHTAFPPGYPALVALLMRAHLTYVWVIIGVNVTFAVIGLLAVYYIFRLEGFNEASVLGICILSLLSFVFVKYSVIPLTDTVFFGVSTCGLALMKQTVASEFSWRRLVGSVVLVTASLCIRRVGIALIPALLYSVVFQPGVRLYIKRLSFRTKAASVLVAGSVGAGMVWVISTTATLSDYRMVQAGQTLIDSARDTLAFHLKELGEIAVNLPESALPLKFQGTLPVIGVFVFLLIFTGIARRKQFGVIDVYFVSYVAVILVWPFYDPRFWLPVIPFLIAYSGLGLKRLAQRKLVVHIVEVYIMAFAVVGVCTIAFNTVLSLSGSRFGDLYPERIYHSTYCAVWHCKDVDSAGVNADGVHLLLLYRQNQTSLVAR
jgi:hypothetical protein